MCTAEQSVPATAPCIRCHTLNRKKSSFSFKYRIRFFSLEGRTQYCPSGFGADGDVDGFFFRKTCRAGRGLGLWFGAGFGAVVLGFWFWSVVCSVDLGSMVLGSVDFGSVDFGPYFWSVVLGL